MAPAPPIVEVAFLKPAPELARFISGYHWYRVDLAGGPALDDVFYPAWANVRFQLEGPDWSVRIGHALFDPIPRAAVFGPTSHASYARSHGGTLAGAGLTPLGWSRLSAADAAAFADRIVPIGDVLGRAGDRLASAIRGAADLAAIARIFDVFFTARMLGDSCDDRIEAVHLLVAEAPPITVAEAAERLDINQRSLNRLALRAFGFGPKLLLRRARFLRTLMALRDEGSSSWSERLDPGYHDHSHFVRDAHEFLGMSPREFLKYPKPLNDASTRLRTAQLGAPAQALHRPG